jgi:hypothetical protein
MTCRLLCLSVALGAGLAGCANPRAELALAARDALAGLERRELLACAGVPDRSREEGDTEFFTYDSQQIEGRAGFYYGGGVFSGGYGRPYGRFALTPGADFTSQYCEATFVLESGVVERVTYVTASGVGSARYAQCYYIIESCLDSLAGERAGEGDAGAGPDGRDDAG